MTNPHYIRWTAADRTAAAQADYAHLWGEYAGTPGPGQVFPSRSRCIPPPVQRLAKLDSLGVVILDHVGNVPADAVASINEQEAGFIVWTRPVPEWDARRCIVCRADVFRLQSEVCPHE